MCCSQSCHHVRPHITKEQQDDLKKYEGLRDLTGVLQASVASKQATIREQSLKIRNLKASASKMKARVEGDEKRDAELQTLNTQIAELEGKLVAA